MKGIIKKIFPDDVFRSFFVCVKRAFYGSSKSGFSEKGKSQGFPFLKEEGALCSGCRLCEKVCPSEALSVETVKKGGEWRLDSFTQDPSRCVLCGICVEACPTDALSSVGTKPFVTEGKPEKVYLKKSGEE